jgi:4-amino-4-deoxy-L-arabinose transferase-like glycosyltransferase
MRMALSENYLMPFFDPETPFFGKPPLSFWASAISLKFFGFNEFAARLPHYLALLLSCLILYQSIKKIFDEKTALFSVVILSSSMLFYALHFVMTEAFLLLGMTMISCSFLLVMRQEKFYDLLFFLGCVISMLTKGPVGIVMPCLAIPIYLTRSHEWEKFFQKFPLICGSIFFICATLPWFLLAEKNYPGFLNYFFLGENFGRFMKAGWNGDRYGHAHHVAFGMIWLFFITLSIPTIFALLIRPREIKKTFLVEFKSDKNFQFFVWSFLMPMILLTFMRNMIGTYAIYSLIPFSVLMARIFSKIKWEKFLYFLSCTTIVLYCLAIVFFSLKPSALTQALNYQSYLVDQIPDKDYQLYYIADGRMIFSLYWASKDEVKIINSNNFFEAVNLKNSKPSYLLGDSQIFDKWPVDQREKFKKLTCIKINRSCLYELIK